jgi:hypothetical protein
MRRLPKHEKIEADPLAYRIFDEVVYSMDQYTHDSILPKFYLPESYLQHCRSTASIFTQIHYAPLLTPHEAMRSRLFGLLFLSIACGSQTYLKERSIFTNYAPYSIQLDSAVVKDVKNRVTKMLFEGATILETTDQAMKLFLDNLVTPRQVRRLAILNREFDAEKFDRFMPASILWGYLFAKEMVLDLN